MRCSNCGQDVQDGLKFCTSCGSPIQMKPVSSVQETEDDRGGAAYDPNGSEYAHDQKNYYYDPNAGGYQNYSPYGGGYYQKTGVRSVFTTLAAGGSRWKQITMLSAVVCLLLSFLPMVWPNSNYRQWIDYYTDRKLAGGYANLYSLAISGGHDYFVVYLFLMSILLIFAMQYLKHPWLSALGFAGIVRSMGEMLQIHNFNSIYSGLFDETTAYYSDYSNVTVIFWLLLLIAYIGMFSALVSGEKESNNLSVSKICKYAGVCGAAMGSLTRFYPIFGREAYSGWDMNYKRYANLKLWALDTDGINVLIFFLCLTTALQIILLLTDHPLLSLIGSGAMLLYIIIVISSIAGMDADVTIGFGFICMIVSLLITTAAGLVPLLLNAGRKGPYVGRNQQWDRYSQPAAPQGGYHSPQGNYNAPQGDYNAPQGNYNAPQGDYYSPQGNMPQGDMHDHRN